MTLNRIELIKALERCLPCVDTQNDAFWLTSEAIMSSTSIMSISVAFKFPEKLDVCVKATDLHHLLKKFSTEEIDLVVKDEALHIKAGKAKAKLSCYIKKLPVIFQDVEEDRYARIPNNFFDALELCYIPSNNAVMAGIFVQNCNMYSTDKAKINNAMIHGDMPTFWINDAAVKILLKNREFTSYTVIKGVIVFVSEDGTEFACKRLNDEQYPIATLHKYLAFDSGEDVYYDLPEELPDVIKRASPLAEKADNATYINLKFAPDGLTVSTGKNSGEYEEFIEGEFDFTDEIVLDYKHVMYGLGRATAAKIVTQEFNKQEMKVLILHNVSVTESVHILVVAR